MADASRATIPHVGSVRLPRRHDVVLFLGREAQEERRGSITRIELRGLVERSASRREVSRFIIGDSQRAKHRLVLGIVRSISLQPSDRFRPAGTGCRACDNAEESGQMTYPAITTHPVTYLSGSSMSSKRIHCA